VVSVASHGRSIDGGLGHCNHRHVGVRSWSLPLRVGKQFSGARKLGKTHQNVLVFVKGDPKCATEACGDVEVVLPDEMTADA